MILVRKEVDMAGKLRAIIQTYDGQVHMFKFQEQKTDDEILAEAERALDARARAFEDQRLAEIAQLEERLTYGGPEEELDAIRLRIAELEG